MKTFWATVGKAALKVAVYAVGHPEVVAQTMADAKAKNVRGIVVDAATIVGGVKGS